MKALLLDDDRSILTLLQRVLTRSGYEVQAYPDPSLCPLYSAKSCVECASVEQGCPDLILTDILMPHVTGIEFLEELKRIGCKCRHIAMMSGDWQDCYVEKASMMGVHMFAKPFHIGQFEHWLGTVAVEYPRVSLPGAASAPVG
jgi:DNA-binding response OmpR family regulator